MEIHKIKAATEVREDVKEYPEPEIKEDKEKKSETEEDDSLSTKIIDVTAKDIKLFGIANNDDL